MIMLLMYILGEAHQSGYVKNIPIGRNSSKTHKTDSYLLWCLEENPVWD